MAKANGYKKGKLNNTMVFSVLVDILGDVTKRSSSITPNISNVSNASQNNLEDSTTLIKTAKQNTYSIEQVNALKIKLLENHLLLENSSIDNIFSILNSVDNDMLKNKVTVSVLLDLIEKEVVYSIDKKFNGIDKLDNFMEQLSNKKNSKNIALFRESVTQMYRLREIVLYSLFPMVYSSFVRNNRIEEGELNKLHSIATSQGFQPQKLERVKKQLKENMGFGPLNIYKSLAEKIQDKDILYKLGTDIEVVSVECVEDDIGCGGLASLANKFGKKFNDPNALKTIISNKILNNEPRNQPPPKKNGNNFISNMSSQLTTNLNIEESNSKDLDNLFTILEKNSDIVIILELLDIIRGNLVK